MLKDSKFDNIRPFYDDEVNAALRPLVNDPMMKAIMEFTFPNKSTAEWVEILNNIQSTQDFQGQVVYNSLNRILEVSCTEGMTTSGFEKLEKNKAYLFISNHRDIILDTSLLNMTLFTNEMLLTASAIGDNLVKKPFLYTLSKINRNFLVLRNLPPRELLQSSRLMSEYIYKLITEDNRSVWLAQREGRTKDGLDATHPGVLKMLSIPAPSGDLSAYFRTLNIVPISISYEYDPTDSLKIPELLANLNNEKYIKGENEDFNTLYNGLIGQKKRIHIHAGNILSEELDIISEIRNPNQQTKTLAQLIDRQIVGNYKLWSTNYIAYDMLHTTSQYSNEYTAAEKEVFENRMSKKIDINDPQSVERFLSMYANPVANKMLVLESREVVV
jgi:1-acyl-sn-glycerol-3-phosphate acyltransferase